MVAIMVDIMAIVFDIMVDLMVDNLVKPSNTTAVSSDCGFNSIRWPTGRAQMEDTCSAPAYDPDFEALVQEMPIHVRGISEMRSTPGECKTSLVGCILAPEFIKAFRGPVHWCPLPSGRS